MPAPGWDRIRDYYEHFVVWSNREPWLTIRRILWIVTSGWWLASSYIVAACGMVLSIVFCPFAPQAFRFAMLSFDIVTLEVYTEGRNLQGDRRHWTRDPLSPFCIAANITWLVLFGWPLTLGHLTAALAQALTIIGIPTAVVSLTLARFALWPFGQSIRRRSLPTTVEELRQGREHRSIPSLQASHSSARMELLYQDDPLCGTDELA